MTIEEATAKIEQLADSLADAQDDVKNLSKELDAARAEIQELQDRVDSLLESLKSIEREAEQAQR